ncbi:sensor domain-containing diguanylate cyclase [Undibacterium sp. TS12]|uniref:sensor domain-containing diguanylate cyclase n=1 Tax=Undibacterium sp. TS12 TaxID=2908202 RepID=UPI001F4CA03F|nr:sensor domain-containing diguanylate cyclase [Undibacterium sp. TS12]MCH8620940.1 diguanylate cyclase [Undibacterium sp. TS12]
MSDTPLQPIASLLIHRVFKWVILCVVLVSSLQAWFNYRAIEDNFDMAINDVAQAHLPLLSVTLWDIELQTIQKQIRLILKNTSIAYVNIRASTGQQFNGGDVKRAVGGQRMVFDIPAPADPGRSLGSVEFVIDKSVLRRELLRSFIVVLAETLVLSVFIYVAVVAILRHYLEKPMRQLADFVKNLQADQLSTKLELKRRPANSYNEIDLVVDGFRTMQDSLQKHITNQDALVAERTSQLEEAMRALKQLAITDGLTGCYNRLLFNERMPGEMQRAIRYQRHLSVLFCDIDNFKSVNDLYGHAIGDKVLIAFAQSLKNALRSEVDWVVRYGGEEFILILPETAFTAAVEVAERIRQQVEQHLSVSLAEGQVLHVTASFGVAELRAADSMESLVQRADQWLYFAKSHGRNQVQPNAASSAALDLHQSASGFVDQGG